MSGRATRSCRGLQHPGWPGGDRDADASGIGEAIVVDVLPDKDNAAQDNAAQDLGVLNIAGALPSSIAPVR